MGESVSKKTLGIIAIVLVSLLAVSITSIPGKAVLQSPTDTPTVTASPTAGEAFEPIYDATQAVDASMSLFPPKGTPASPIARLVSRSSFENWSMYTGLSATQVAAARITPDWGLENPSAPIWFVAILGTGLYVKDVLHPPGDIEVSDTRSVNGAYYAWDAGTGRLLEEGALVVGNAHSYQSIVALPTENIAITEATQRATSAPMTPEPSETLVASASGTIAAKYTAQAIKFQTATPTP